MKEAPYTSSLSRDIEIDVGGKVIKISDRSTLGLPDSMHLLDGIVTYIETKIEENYTLGSDNVIYVQPWRSVKKDIRQYEVCRSIAKHSCVVYAIYYPIIKMSCVIPVEVLAQFRPQPGESFMPYLCGEEYLRKGRGLSQLKEIMDQNRGYVYGRLSKSFS